MFGSTNHRQRYFTPFEANQTLRRVMPDLERAVERAHQHEAFLRALKSGDVPAHEHEEVLEELEQLQEEIQVIVEKLHGIGIEVKGLRDGLIDFPALRSGQEVFLCWRTGETVVSHWHPLHSGFASRMPLDPSEEPGLWEWCN
jgi:hypothetical protein